MSIECRLRNCPFHSNDGPFCHEAECRNELPVVCLWPNDDYYDVPISWMSDDYIRVRVNPDGSVPTYDSIMRSTS